MDEVLYTPYETEAVANYFISKSKKIKPIKLIKLVYISHGWHLALFDGPLIHERIQAARYGPTVRSLFNGMIRHRGKNIKCKLKDFEKNIYVPEINYNDSKTREFLKVIWNKYGKFTDVQLANLSHCEGSPWKQIYEKHNECIPRNEIILDKQIKQYYKETVME